jgi:hypothetical protein
MKFHAIVLGGTAAMLFAATPVLAADPMNATQNEAQINKTDDASTAEVAKDKAARAEQKDEKVKTAETTPAKSRHHRAMSKMAIKGKSSSMRKIAVRRSALRVSTSNNSIAATAWPPMWS